MLPRPSIHYTEFWGHGDGDGLMQIAAPCVSVFCCSCVCGSLNIPANFSSFFSLNTFGSCVATRGGTGLGCMQCRWLVQCADGKRCTRWPATDARCGVAVWVKRQLKRRRLSSSVPCQNRGGCIACRVGSHSLINIRPGWFSMQPFKLPPLYCVYRSVLIRYTRKESHPGYR